MDAVEFVKTHLALDCIGVDDLGYLVRLPGPCPAAIPRFYIAELTGSGNHVRFTRQGLLPAVAEKLLALPPGVALENRGAVRQVLAADAHCRTIRRNKSYLFPAALDPQDFAGVVRLGAADRELVTQFDARIDTSDCPVFAVIAGGRIVSACTSSRETGQGAEAWVQTVPTRRRSGLGRRVVAAWGHYQLSQGKVPFYTLAWDNLASQALAESLELIQFVSDVSYV